MTKIQRIIILISFFWVLLSLVYFFALPDVSQWQEKKPATTALIQYREREAKKKGKIFKIHQNWIALSRVSPFLIKAVLIAEDDKFWKHEGFDYESIREAIEKDIKVGRFKFGGSTISQQLAKNLYLSPEKDPLRKISEAAITWKMEKVLPKRRILELYLNVAEWGEGIFGVEVAARHYYGKSAAALTPVEAVRLAAVLPNPRKYNPIGTQSYVKNRGNLIYSMMVRRGIVVPGYEEMKENGQTLTDWESASSPASDEPLLSSDLPGSWVSGGFPCAEVPSSEKLEANLGGYVDNPGSLTAP